MSLRSYSYILLFFIVVAANGDGATVKGYIPFIGVHWDEK